ncbi:hypothetical protein ACIPRL_08130 [Streptomyces sp. NPDC090085]|uniref:hypothetical protein n=1 Tax=Streptomyces sp. NPDC090085 TaxID=3365943 RepID=UPI00382E6FD3
MKWWSLHKPGAPSPEPDPEPAGSPVATVATATPSAFDWYLPKTSTGAGTSTAVEVYKPPKELAHTEDRVAAGAVTIPEQPKPRILDKVRSVIRTDEATSEATAPKTAPRTQLPLINKTSTGQPPPPACCCPCPARDWCQRPCSAQCDKNHGGNGEGDGGDQAAEETEEQQARRAWRRTRELARLRKVSVRRRAVLLYAPAALAGWGFGLPADIDQYLTAGNLDPSGLIGSAAAFAAAPVAWKIARAFGLRMVWRLGAVFATAGLAYGLGPAYVTYLYDHGIDASMAVPVAAGLAAIGGTVWLIDLRTAHWWWPLALLTRIPTASLVLAVALYTPDIV